MVTYTQDTNPEIEIARNVGIGELSFFSRIHHGGGAACGTVQQAAMAVATGVAEVVVCYRAFNERSGNRFGVGVQNRPPMANAENAHFSWYAPFGLLTPAQWVAMFATRYMHEFGATSEDFGRVAVADRKHAATNPKAVVLREAHHPRRPSAVTLDRRAAPPARLLPGERRRAGDRRHQRGARPRPGQPACGRPRRRPGRGPRPGHDDELLPGEHLRPPGDGAGGPTALEHDRARPRRHRRRHHLRPLHPVRALPARGVRLLRPGRGQGLHARRRHRARRPAAGEHPRGPAGRGLHPRHERHRRGRAPGAGHLGQPGRRTPSTCSSPRAPACRPAG